MGTMGEWRQKEQNCSYKINNSQGFKVQHDNYNRYYDIIYLEVAEREDLKSSHCKKMIFCNPVW